MGLQVVVASKLNLGRRRQNARKLATSDPKPGDLAMGRLRAVFCRRAELVGVAKPWEDLWLGVIRQANLVIAGFPRNICKYSR